MGDQQNKPTKVDCQDLENGPLEDRQCRDIFCCILFIANIAAMVYCSYYAYTQGNTYSIFRGTDQDKNICGYGATADYPYLYFTDPLSLSVTKRVCVKQCPVYGSNPSLAALQCYTNSVIPNCNYDQTISNDGTSINNESPGSGGYSIVGYDSTSVVDRICMPSANTLSYLTSIGVSAISSFSSMFQSSYLMNLVTDIKNNWHLFLAGMGVAVVLSFVIMFLMKCIAGIVVWVSIIGTFLSLVALGLLFMYSGGQFGSTNQMFMGYTIPTVGADVQYIKYYGYAVLGVAGLFILIILCMCGRIRLAVALCGCAGKYIVDVMTSVLVPIVMSVFTVALWAVCIICMLYLVSAASFIADSDVFTSFQTFKDTALIQFYYFVFGTLWCNALLGAIGTFLIASSVCMWYYSHGPGQDLHLPILRSLGRVFRYHLGSLAFGALILAIIQFIELVVEVIKQQVTKAGADRSKAVEYVLSCVQCYLACLERVVAFLNKNAYIQIALRGKNFCMASKDGFEIIWSNPLRFGVVGGVGSVIMFIGKLLIASATTAIMWAIFNYTSWGTITSPLLPLLVVFVYSWVISLLFMAVYELAMDTLLVCFIVDETNQKERGSNTPKYAPEDLLALMDN